MAYTILALFILIFITTGILYIYRDHIGKELLARANEIQKGELHYDELTFNPFVHFPVISIRLENVTYLIPTSTDTITQNDTIAKIQDIYGSINIWELINGHIKVSRITMKDGYIQIEEKSDGSINIMNAFAGEDYERDDMQGKNDMDASADSSTFIFLDKFRMKDIGIKYTVALENTVSEVFIDELAASLSYQPEIIQSRLDLKLKVLNLPLYENLTGDALDLELNTSFSFERDSQKIILEPSMLKVEELLFELEGAAELRDKVIVDLSIQGSDKNFSIVNSLLSYRYFEKLKSGTVHFNGTVKGSFGDQIPEIDLNFGLEDVNAEVPGIDKDLSGLNLNGHFNSGIKSDLSMARLRIDTLYANLPGGQLNASLSIEDFITPAVEYILDIDSEISGIDESIDVKGVSDLQGYIRIKDRFRGKYNDTIGFLEEGSGYTVVILDSISFVLDSLWKVENISGRLERDKDTLEIHDLNIITDHSDFLINGRSSTIWDMLFGLEKEIYADLKIISDTLDLPEAFAFEPIVGRSFPYRMIDTEIEFGAITSTNRLTEYSFNPEMQFWLPTLIFRAFAISGKASPGSKWN